MLPYRRYSSTCTRSLRETESFDFLVTATYAANHESIQAEDLSSSSSKNSQEVVIWRLIASSLPLRFLLTRPCLFFPSDVHFPSFPSADNEDHTFWYVNGMC
jgi:hypothetical protein